jgi:hypothetical protein
VSKGSVLRASFFTSTSNHCPRASRRSRAATQLSTIIVTTVILSSADYTLLFRPAIRCVDILHQKDHCALRGFPSHSCFPGNSSARHFMMWRRQELSRFVLAAYPTCSLGGADQGSYRLISRCSTPHNQLNTSEISKSGRVGLTHLYLVTESGSHNAPLAPRG